MVIGDVETDGDTLWSGVIERKLKPKAIEGDPRQKKTELSGAGRMTG
jgi:hypothetical protein